MSRPNTRVGSRLLISICNVPFDPRPSCLLRMDTDTYHAEPVPIGFSDPVVVSGLGLCADDNYVFHLSLELQSLATQLSVLDRRDLKVLHVQPLPEIDDCHSVARRADKLYVASTGTDEVFVYRLRGCEATEPRVAWSPTGTRSDTHHVNSVAIVKGDVLCSAFGPKDGDSWVSATNGYIHNVTTDKRLLGGLRQPHTVISNDRNLYFCNSKLGTVNADGEIMAFLSGYSRGLAFGPDGTMYAATSVGRRPIDDPTRTDTFGNPTGVGDLNGRCAVVRFTRGGFRTEISLSSSGFEIYDLLLL